MAEKKPRTNDDLVWSTEKIKQWYEKYSNGEITPESPWLNNIIGIRKPKIVYQYTKQELEEFTKCAQDVTYFAKYCEIMHGTEGYKPTVLRDYQKRLLKDYKKYRFNAVIACRQAGKCFFNGKITINKLDKNKDFIIEDLYYKSKNKSFLSFIKNLLLKIYRKSILKNIILFLIELIESYEYRNLQLDETDISKKIIDTVDISGEGLKVLSHDGYHTITHIHKTQPYTIYILSLESGEKLECADNHIIFCKGFIQKFVKDLTTDDYVMTKNGLSKVCSVLKTNHKISMYDVTVDSEDHSFYSNDILSHNTTTSCIFLLHEAFFNTDRNIGIAANKALTATEILSKIKEILFRIPPFLMPGVKYISGDSITFENGCRIICQATTPRSFIGYTIHTLYLDEFAHVEPHMLNAFYENIVPTVSSMLDSKVIVTSTQNGFNKFYEICEGAKNGTNAYHLSRIDWWDVHDDKWRDEQIKLLGEDEFIRQYGNVFSNSGDMLLSSATLEKFNKSIKKFVYRDIKAVEDHFVDGFSNLVWREDFDIDELTNPKKKFLIAVDLAEGGGGKADYTVFQILELKLKENIVGIVNFEEMYEYDQVGIFRSNSTSLDIAADLLYRIVVQTIGIDNCVLIIEMNTYGSYFTNMLLQIDGDDNEFEKSCICQFESNKLTHTMTYGIRLNSQNKQIYCVLFRRLCSNDIFNIYHKATVEEAECFCRVGDTYKANGSATSHDDTIMPLVEASAFEQTQLFRSCIEDLLDSENKFDQYEKNLDNKSENDGFAGITSFRM